MGPKGIRQAEQTQSICTIDFSHCSRPDGGEHDKSAPQET